MGNFDWNAATQFGIALVTFLTVIFNWWSTNRKLGIMKEDIRTVEVATNSMKDALVASTAREATAAGFKTGHAAGLAEQKLVSATGFADEKLADAAGVAEKKLADAADLAEQKLKVVP